MTSVQPAERESAQAAEHDSDRASEHSLSASDTSPPSQKNNKKRSHDDSDKDEPETKSAREDLRQTRISDREKSKSPSMEQAMGNSETSRVEEVDKDMEDPSTVDTPPEPQSPQDQDAEMKDRLSPKKKRPRENQDDDVPASTTDGDKSVNGSAVDGGSALPMKKRHRDASQEKKSTEAKDSTTSITAPSTDVITSPTSSEPPLQRVESPSKAAPQTAPTSFASSGFAALASAPSPFAVVGSSKPSVFGGNAGQTLSGFGTLASSKETTPLSGFGSLASNSTSGFGGAATGGFGGLSGGFGGGFGSGFSGAFGNGQRLSSFAAPAPKTNQADAPAKPATKKEKAFGAPESSEDEESDDEDSDAEAGDDEDDDKPAAEEKKKSKVPRAPILDGEEDEITLCQVRAKLFSMGDKSWKERGTGAIKINIPRSESVKMTYDSDGEDEDELDLITQELTGDDNGKSIGQEAETRAATKSSYSARLIMRQDSTHRVILNSVILKDQTFQEKALSNAVGILFTAFEDGKPVSMQLKMNPHNAKELLRELDEVKGRL